MLAPALSQTSTGACVAPPAGTTYWDIGARGDSGPGNHSSGVTFQPRASILTDFADYPGGNTSFRANLGTNPAVVRQYCNGSKIPPEAGGAAVWYQVPPGTNEGNVPTPIFSLTAGATVDEGNNWISMTWGPLSLTSPANGAILGDYSLTSGSGQAIGYIAPGTSTTTYNLAPATDFFDNPRKTNGSVDIGAVEFAAAPNTPIASVSGGPLNFGNVIVGTTSGSQTLTLSNTGTASVTGIGLTFTGPFSRSGGSCGTTLTAGANCTINVVFQPTVVGPASGSLTIASNVAVAGSPVSLSGTGVAAVTSATLTPTLWTPTQTRNCPGTTIGQILACLGDPAQLFTFTNTGNTTITGIAQGVLGGANVADYAKVNLLSTCGPAGGGQLVSTLTLAPGASCVVTVQFRPLTSEAAGTKNATITVNSSAGAVAAILRGQAN
jgi:hypothetical protein